MLRRFLLRGLGLAGFAIAVSLVLGSHAAHAATPGRLIDDSVFDNAGTMSGTDIQNFLNGFPNSCIKSYSDAMPIDYFNYGAPASAASIIRRASDYWGINPRVILTKLQQEQSLVTGGAGCAGWRYTGAMGFNCPEGTSCPQNPANAGFSRQVMKASWLLMISQHRAIGDFSWEDPADNGWYYGGPMTQGNRKRCGTCATIYYDGWSNVGGTNVFVETGATASLYYYTPHIPSSFPGIWESWWGAGSTWQPTYAWQFVGQTSDHDLSNLPVGQKATWTLTAKNVGSVTWTNSGPNPIRLGTNRPRDRSSTFCSTGWVICSRPATMNEASVAPGQNATFTFVVQAPYAGQYLEYFNLVAEGITWMNDPGLAYYAKIVPPNFAYTILQNNFPTTMSPGASASVQLQVRNDSNVSWYTDGSKFPIRIGTTNMTNRMSVFCDQSWLACHRPAAIAQSSVDPGQTATLSFNIKAPPAAGVYAEQFGLTAEGYQWLSPPINQTITIPGQQITTPVYRLYNPYSISHFYTASAAERDNAIARLGFGYEGVAFTASQSSTATPVYRLYNPYSISHFFTTSPAERDNAIANLHFGYEGVAFFASTSATNTPVYRLYNPYSISHFYTASAAERDNAVNNLHFTFEGTAFYAMPH